MTPEVLVVRADQVQPFDMLADGRSVFEIRFTRNPPIAPRVHDSPLWRRLNELTLLLRQPPEVELRVGRFLLETYPTGNADWPFMFRPGCGDMATVPFLFATTELVVIRGIPSWWYEQNAERVMM